MTKVQRPKLFRRLLNIPTRIKTFFSEKQDDNTILDTMQNVIEHPFEIMPHLVALRNHLIRMVLYMVVTTAISFTFSTKILEFLASPLPGGLAALQAVDVTETVGTVMRVSLLSGFAMAFPLIAIEVWLFFAPGLYGHERLYTMFAIPFATVFFVLGMAFAFYYMLPVAIPMLIGFIPEIKTLVRPNSYFPFVVNMLFWIGLFTEFPLVILILARLGVVKGRDLLNQWRIAVVIIAIVAAVITPTTDLANMALTMAPMIFLYVISIILAFMVQRNRQAPGSSG